MAMRSHYCGLVTEALMGQTVQLCGWVNRRRDHGGVIFIDLRDREGYVQVVCDPDRAEMFSTAGGKLLSVGKAERDAIIAKAPFYSHGVIPGGTYKGFDKDVETLTVGAQWLVSVDTDEQLVYDITKALWNKNSRKLLDNGHAKGKSVQLQTALDAVGIPVHPGAARFYREQGMKVPDIK